MGVGLPARFDLPRLVTSSFAREYGAARTTLVTP
jgi:hypothetical protein